MALRLRLATDLPFRETACVEIYYVIDTHKRRLLNSLDPVILPQLMQLHQYEVTLIDYRKIRLRIVTDKLDTRF